MYRINRSRSLEMLSERLGSSFSLASTIHDLLKTRNSLDILEIGFGYGHVLLELAWLFRDQKVRFNGVDKRLNIANDDELREAAAHFNIIPPSDLDRITLPLLHSYDATSMHFADESIDFVYSAFVVRFIERKDKFIEEVCRVLRPGGRAVIHIGGANWNYPYGRKIDNRHLTNFLNRFVLKYGDELIPLPIYMKLFEGNTFNFKFADHPHCILLIHKTASGKLNLNLDYDEKLSMPGRKLPLRNRKGEIKGGFRSVYHIHGQYYDALFDRELLSIEYIKHTRKLKLH